MELNGLVAHAPLKQGYRAFIDADAKRHGWQVDYGMWWKRRGDARRFRVSWIPLTGEIYAVALGPQNRDEYIQLAQTEPEAKAAADALLHGWDDPHSRIYQNLEELIWRLV